MSNREAKLRFGAPSITLRSLRSLLTAPAPLPKALEEKMRRLGPEEQKQLTDVLKATFFNDPEWYPDPDFFDTEPGKKDLDDHIVGRTNNFRAYVVPWIDSFLNLAGSRILEIGCGTGASTVAMAEQGAIVTGIDINPQALAAARCRCALYGVQANFVQGNAGTELSTIARRGHYDAVIFFAVMEHLTWSERLACVRGAWELLESGQFLLVVEAPNRLWHTDFHTSWEPFFMWLPDEVALAYTGFCRRDTFKEAFRERGEDDRTRKERLARWGRGVSYHDFEIALDMPASQLPVASAMWDFHRSGALRRVAARFSQRQRFSQILHSLNPGVHPSFFDPSIDIAVRKP